MRYLLFCLGWMLAGGAWADVSLYGEIKAGMTVTHTDMQASSKMAASDRAIMPTGLVDHGSFIGLRGQTPLGNSGLRAIWQVEQNTPLSPKRRR